MPRSGRSNELACGPGFRATADEGDVVEDGRRHQRPAFAAAVIRTIDGERLTSVWSRLRVLDTTNAAGKLRYRIISVPVGLVAINPQVLLAECQTWVQGTTHPDSSSLREQGRLTLTLRHGADCADE